MKKIACAIVIFLVFACKKNKNTVNCQSTSTDASFIIFEMLQGENPMSFEADTIYVANTVSIRASNPNASTTYQWRIQTNNFNVTISSSNINYIEDTLRHGPFWICSFDSTNFCFYPGRIKPLASCFFTITCIATKSTICSASTNTLISIDSTKKIFYLWPNEVPFHQGYPQISNTYNYLPIWGTYAGYKHRNPTKLVYVTLFDTVFTQLPFSCSSGLTLPLYVGKIKNLAYDNYLSINYYNYMGQYGANNDCFYECSRGGSGIVFSGVVTHKAYNNNSCYGISSQYVVCYQGYAYLDVQNSKKVFINYAIQDTMTGNEVSDYFTGYKVN